MAPATVGFFRSAIDAEPPRAIVHLSWSRVSLAAFRRRSTVRSCGFGRQPSSGDGAHGSAGNVDVVLVGDGIVVGTRVVDDELELLEGDVAVVEVLVADVLGDVVAVRDVDDDVLVVRVELDVEVVVDRDELVVVVRLVLVLLLVVVLRLVLVLLLVVVVRLVLVLLLVVVLRLVLVLVDVDEMVVDGADVVVVLDPVRHAPVVTSSRHWSSDPPSPAASSETVSVHVPFGSSPVKAANDSSGTSVGAVPLVGQ
jgi:hypothetical protein